MLARNLLHGRYNPFVVNDLFSGRVMRVAYQSIVYRIGGVNIYSTLSGSLFTTILCCYLVVFRLVRQIHIGGVIVTSALFYFNSVLNASVLMPDVEVMLAGLIIFLIWRENPNEQGRVRIFSKGILIGFVVCAAMFFKETALIFIPFVLTAAFICRRKNDLKVALIATLAFLIFIVLAGFVYYYATGDFFFKVKQIQNAIYIYSRSCSLETGKHPLLQRLTYAVWANFITTSYYPVIFVSIMILLRILFDKPYRLKRDSIVSYFIILTILGLYFPFSLRGYQPLCFKSRHFLFLLPLAVGINASIVFDAWKDKRLLTLCLIASAFLLTTCVLLTGEKWYWMIYGLLFMYFALQTLISPNSLFYNLRYVTFAGILSLYLFYHLFFLNSDWFKNMRTISTTVNDKYFYFPEHDNMMNWKLLHGFDDSIHCYNLGKDSYKGYASYYEKVDSVNFHPGWFVVNKSFGRRPVVVSSVDSLNRLNYFSRAVVEGDLTAFFIDDSVQMATLRKIISADPFNR